MPPGFCSCGSCWHYTQSSKSVHINHCWGANVSQRLNPHVLIFLFSDLFLSRTTFHPNNCLVRERYAGWLAGRTFSAQENFFIWTLPCYIRTTIVKNSNLLEVTKLYPLIKISNKVTANLKTVHSYCNYMCNSRPHCYLRPRKTSPNCGWGHFNILVQSARGLGFTCAVKHAVSGCW